MVSHFDMAWFMHNDTAISAYVALFSQPQRDGRLAHLTQGSPEKYMIKVPDIGLLVKVEGRNLLAAQY